MAGFTASDGAIGKGVSDDIWAFWSRSCICWENMAAAVFCWIRLLRPLISSWVFKCGGGWRYLQFSLAHRPFKESKQATTRPFSTWQSPGGWANLQSASAREQVPLWYSLQTSNVSHLVSRTRETLTVVIVNTKWKSSAPSLGQYYCCC